MSEHTKTPWAVGYGDGIGGDVASWSAYMGEVECHEVVIRSGREAIAVIYYGDSDSNAEANARHIVHCVNNHDRLVKALENLHRYSLSSFDYRGSPQCAEVEALLAALEAEKGGGL